MKNIAMLLNGAVAKDTRVKNVIYSLSKKNKVHLYYLNGIDTDSSMFNSNVILHSVIKKKSSFYKIIAHTFFFLEYNYLFKEANNATVKFDIVYANDLPVCYPSYRLAKKDHAYFIYDSHEIYLETINQFFLQSSNIIKNLVFQLLIMFMKMTGSFFESYIMKKAGAIITVNESLQNYFISKYSISPQKIGVVMNCPNKKREIDADTFDFREYYGWEGANKIMIYQGALNNGRGLLLLINAIEKLPENYTLVILGNGILKQRLMSITKEKGLEKRIKFYGSVPEGELFRYTKGADIGINLLEPFNLSKKLASPNKLFQYIASKIPSVCSNTIENRKVIDEFETGVLVENNVDDITEKIKSLKLMEFKNINFEKAAKKYCWGNQEKILLSITDTV